MHRRKAPGCRLLLGSLVALLVAFPFLEEVTRPTLLILPVAGVFVLGVVAVNAGRRHIIHALILAATQIILTIVSLVLRQHPIPYRIGVSLTMAAIIALMLYSMYCVLHYVMRARVITTDQIFAGICAYLMLGFAFGGVFYLLNILSPDSFGVNSRLPVTGDSPDLMYFSFVTLATLGYGDISPLSRLARSLAELEALTGTLYMAVFMARLVSLRASPGD